MLSVSSVVKLLPSLFRAGEQIDRGTQPALALEEALRQAVDQPQEGEQIADTFLADTADFLRSLQDARPRRRDR